ncbi:MAG: FIG002577: Putative lipoprotein precursor [uncultured Thiotrichaceae bacterium]|uniref:FIG002577: Putative lipoprotein n=1 Tax=uncultured Thiotrichaceae bacterium TaxID=298394 RepID=A0A6S6UHF5_9GAMM|nr:MAG: FIG002577: Putative lipoprotein precursor [uncultured Thiotrichaceae bacterium]
MLHQRILFFIVALLLSGCSPMDINQYKNFEPKLDIFKYFEGNTRGWGMFQDRSGTLKRQFVVDIKGSVDESGVLILEEDFVWNDGEKTRRVWRISRTSDAHYKGNAEDVIGSAIGVSAGNALHWTYDLNLVVKDKTWKVSFDDWMFLQPDGVLLNRATMKKFGFRLGEVTIAFKKL